LSAYALRGRFPSRNDCVFANPFVTSDSVLNLVRRWAVDDDPHALYCLINAGSLSFDHQREIGKTLENFVATSTSVQRKCPFLIVVSPANQESNEESAIEVMFASTGRIALAPLPVSVLRTYIKCCLESRGVTAKSYVSRQPGQGKTHQIRKAAASIDPSTNACIFRINAIQSLDFLIRLADESRFSTCVHVDVSDSSTRNANGALSAILFDFILLNGFVDEATGNSCIWKSNLLDKAKHMFVEVPSQAPLSELRLCHLLDLQTICPSAKTFDVNFEQLKLGMGMDDFFSLRYDGGAILSENPI
jgi:hypothetical protein